MAQIARIEMDTQRLQRDIGLLREGRERARSHINELRNKMDAMNNMWEGPANAAMRQRFQKDYDYMMALCSTVQEMINTLESIRQAYDTCENNVHSLVSALRI